MSDPTTTTARTLHALEQQFLKAIGAIADLPAPQVNKLRFKAVASPHSIIHVTLQEGVPERWVANTLTAVGIPIARTITGEVTDLVSDGLTDGGHKVMAAHDPLDPELLRTYGTTLAYKPHGPLDEVPTRTRRLPHPPRTPMEAMYELGMGNPPIDVTELNLRKYETVLLEERRITEEEYARALAMLKTLEYIDPRRSPPDPALRDAISRNLINQHRVIPHRRKDGTLTVLTSNPLAALVRQSIEDETGERVTLAVSPKSALDALIEELYERRAAMEDLHQEAAARTPQASRATANEDPSSGVTRAVDNFILQAVARGASDLHFQPSSHGLRVRMRVDGRLQDYELVPDILQGAMTARIKVMAEMLVEQKRLPQDKRISFQRDGVDVILRVNSTPTVYGEKIVMRLIRRDLHVPDLAKLHLSNRNLAVVEEALEAKDGMILLTGPTGSGKSTTAHALLARLNTDEVNVHTLEHPIEYEQDGLVQTEVHPDALRDEARFDYPEALTALMRQDPDVIMVGEIRDPTTARISTQAALTGHLIVSTLHTNDAVSTISRLADLQVDRYLIADTVRVVIAQRLVEKPCPDCAVSVPAPAPYTQPGRTVLQGTGTLPDSDLPCPTCGGSGHKGRVAVHEVLRVTPEVRSLIRSGAPTEAVMAAAHHDGMRSLAEDGLEKAFAGLTTLASLHANLTMPTVQTPTTDR